MTINQSMHLASQHHRAGRYAEAEMICRQVLAQAPDHVDALHLLGVLAGQSGHTDDAINLLGRAVRLRPGFEAFSNLGVALREKGRLDEAIDAHRNALRLNPEYADAWRNLGVALQASGQFDDAAAAFERALAIKPDFADVHFNLGVVRLLRGDFVNGWPEYEWRWKLPSQATRPPAQSGQWDGGELGGQTILLYAEQGIGDTLQFVRYVPKVIERGGRVILQCPPPLVPLLRDFPGIQQCFATGQPTPPFDRHCALMSLPLTFATDLDSIPNQVPYINADPRLVERWREQLGRGDEFKVGLVWAGRPAYRNDRIRSLDFAQLSALWGIPGVRFVSLQKGQPKPAPPPEANWADWTDDLHDFSQTAALIQNLDLVISVDTAVAHLAGAMGKVVSLLLPFVPDWRWLLDRDDSPWYPTMRLFRQTALDDWSGVIARVAEQLRQRG